MRYSSRIPWSLDPNRLSQAIDRRRASGEALLDLTQSNPTDAGVEYPVEAIVAAFADPRAIRYDPTPVGLPLAREAVSRYYEGRVSSDRILLTASTSEAYSYLFKLLCDPGDEILVPRPSYPLFEFLAHLESVRVVQYPLHYHDGWYLDTQALRDAVTARTRAIVFVNPNNPTGSFLKESEFAFLAELQIPLVIDEVFSDYAFGEDQRRVANVAARDDVLAFSLSGLSKVCGLPQMKLGWIAVSGPAPARREAFARLEVIADTFLSVGAPVQYAAPALLEMRRGIQEQIRRRTAANLEHLRARCPDSALRILQVEAGWYAIAQVPRVRTEEEWVLHLLEEHGVLVQPGFFYDFESEAYLVLSLLTGAATFCAGVNALLEAAR